MMTHTTRIIGAGAVVLLVLALGFAAVLRVQPVPTELLTAQSATATPDPCAHLADERIMVHIMQTHVVTFTDYVSISHAVARVVVTDVLTARFNTPSGSPPPPPTAPSASPTATPTGAWYEDIDTESAGLVEALQAFRPVVFSVTSAFSVTAGIDGFVVAVWGTDGDEPCPGVSVDVWGYPVIDGYELGTEGTLFAGFLPAGPPGESPFYDQLLQIADDLSRSLNLNYVVAVPASWWWYDDGYVQNVYHDDVELSVSEFEAIVVAAIE